MVWSAVTRIETGNIAKRSLDHNCVQYAATKEIL
jgi:hypothetical protein